MRAKNILSILFIAISLNSCSSDEVHSGDPIVHFDEQSLLLRKCARCYTWCMRDNNIIVEGMSLYGCSDVTCRGKVTCLQGVNDVGTGRGTVSCEKAAGVSFISGARC